MPPGAAAGAGGTAAAGGCRFGAGALRNRAAEAALEGTAGLETLPHSIPAGKGGSRGSRHPQRFQGSSRHGSAATSPRRAAPQQGQEQPSPPADVSAAKLSGFFLPGRPRAAALRRGVDRELLPGL